MTKQEINKNVFLMRHYKSSFEKFTSSLERKRVLSRVSLALFHDVEIILIFFFSLSFSLRMKSFFRIKNLKFLQYFSLASLIFFTFSNKTSTFLSSSYPHRIA